MNVNPDPRPGRWMLPLVVLGMMLFTWVFVNQLPGDGGATEQTTATEDTAQTSDTTVPDGTGGTGDTGDTGSETDTGDSETTGDTVAATPEVEAYVSAMQVFGTQLVDFQTRMATVNAQWDADPKELSLTETTAALDALRKEVSDWSDQVASVAGVPADLADVHQSLVDAAQAASTEAANVYDGLVNSPGVEARLSAVSRFDEAVTAFQQALDQVD